MNKKNDRSGEKRFGIVIVHIDTAVHTQSLEKGSTPQYTAEEVTSLY